MPEVGLDRARYWRHPGVPEVELLDATFVRHAFGRHSHPTYTIALVESGIEEYQHRGETIRAGAGTLAMLDPEEVHTGHAGVPEGWSYRVFYADIEIVESVARDLGFSGTPSFAMNVAADPEATARLRAAHRAGARGDRLSASSLLRHAIEHVVGRYAHGRPRAGERPSPPRAVAEARELLHELHSDPPRLEDLAALVGASPFSLTRGFSAAYGLPPHAYVTQIRLRRAQALLLDGTSPAEVAAEVGFADQAHLTRHFKRHKGVPPGAYQRGFASA